MREQITEGKEVTLRSVHGEISRIAVKVLDDVVRVCRKDEYDLAKREGRAPVTVGFRISDILG
jgi:hypothetical protein